MKLQEILEQQVSFYYDASDAKSIIPVDLGTILNMIKDGWSVGWGNIPRDLKQTTTYIRTVYQTRTEDDYRKAKKGLPMFTGSATFSYRAKERVSTYNNILIIDFDGLQTEKDMLDFKAKVIQWSRELHVFAIWRSPGKGLKAAMFHDNANALLHTALVHEVKNTLYPKTPTNIFDLNCSDVSRACYICYDPDIWISPGTDIEPYHFQNIAGVVPGLPSQSSGARQSYGKFQHSAEERAKNAEWQKVTSDKTLLNKLHKTCDYSNPNYFKDGNRHKEIKRRATLCCKDGVLYENALASLKGKFGPNSKAGMNEKDIESMVNSCYNLARGDFGEGRWRFLQKHP